MGKTIAVNRRARHEYTIDDTFEAGLALTGTEIKSVRAGKVNLADAYAGSTRRGLADRRPHRAVGDAATAATTSRSGRASCCSTASEIDRAAGRAPSQKGQTIVPLRLYLNERGRAKIELGLARGQAAPRPPPRHRRPGRPARRRAGAGRHQPGAELTAALKMSSRAFPMCQARQLGRIPIVE